MRTISYAAAVSEGIREEMARDERVFLIGEDIGSVMAADDLFGAFRERRVFQTPISESGFTGLGVGAALSGLRPIVEIMYCDFVSVCMDPICNQAAKAKLMSGNVFDVPLVIRTPAGCGTREGGHHSQSLEAWFMHTPGLKVVMPSTPYDAKGLLKSAVRDDGVVVFIQHRRLHGEQGEVPEEDYLIPLGSAEVKREGSDLTVVAWSYALRKVQQAAQQLAGEVELEVVDPRSLVPLDLETIVASVKKTGRLLVVHEAPTRSGAGAEIVRRVTEAAFDALVAPPKVLGSLETPMPYSPPLEDAVIPQPWDIVRAARQLVAGRQGAPA